MTEYILPEKEIKDKIILLTMDIGDTLENATKQAEYTIRLIKDLSEHNNTSLEREFIRVCGDGFLQTPKERTDEIRQACKSLGINI